MSPKSHCYSYPDGDCHSVSNCNCYANSYSYCNPQPNRIGYSITNRDCNTNAYRYSNT